MEGEEPIPASALLLSIRSRFSRAFIIKCALDTGNWVLPSLSLSLYKEDPKF